MQNGGGEGQNPSDYLPSGLTCARFKGWQHRHEHIVQEERAAVHSDGARQQTTEVADVSGGGGRGQHKPLPLEVPLYHLNCAPLEVLHVSVLPSIPATRKFFLASKLNPSCCLKGFVLAAPFA